MMIAAAAHAMSQLRLNAKMAEREIIYG
jgi:hypothetical protein